MVDIVLEHNRPVLNRRAQIISQAVNYNASAWPIVMYVVEPVCKSRE